MKPFGEEMKNPMHYYENEGPKKLEGVHDYRLYNPEENQPSHNAERIPSENYFAFLPENHANGQPRKTNS
jgi:hypothetical protein